MDKLKYVDLSSFLDYAHLHSELNNVDSRLFFCEYTCLSLRGRAGLASANKTRA
jgi:hypothetical protein